MVWGKIFGVVVCGVWINIEMKWYIGGGSDGGGGSDRGGGGGGGGGGDRTLGHTHTVFADFSIPQINSSFPVHSCTHRQILTKLLTSTVLQFTCTEEETQVASRLLDNQFLVPNL